MSAEIDSLARKARRSLSPTDTKAARANSTNRVRINKGTLGDLAQAMIEFQKLSPEDQAWVRSEIERIDREEA
jgi:hypothetical protein